MSSLFAAPRLGLASAALPHKDRHGLVFLSFCQVSVKDGDLWVLSAGTPELPAGEFGIPYQALSMVLLGPGCSISQDALRILARHGCGLSAVGEGGVRCYSQPIYGAARSEVARAHARLWADERSRLEVARRMYAIRFSEVLPHRDIAVLRGIEGARVKAAYAALASSAGISWEGRRFDRADPEAADLPNQAINHVVTCVEATSEIAVYAVGGIPALGFIHEDSSNAFTLDVTDLVRTTVTVPLAFSAVKEHLTQGLPLEKVCRKRCVAYFREHSYIARTIDIIKSILEVK